MHGAFLVRPVQVALALLAVWTIAARLLPDCGAYRARPDVWVLIAVTAGAAVALGWGAIDDSDAHRTIALAGVAALLSIVVVDAPFLTPLFVIGVLRLPHARRYLVVALFSAPVAVLVARGLPTLAQLGMSPNQFLCP